MGVRITFDLSKLKESNQKDLETLNKMMEQCETIYLLEQNHGNFRSKQVYSNGLLIDYSIVE